MPPDPRHRGFDLLQEQPPRLQLVAPLSASYLSRRQDRSRSVNHHAVPCVKKNGNSYAASHRSHFASFLKRHCDQIPRTNGIPIGQPSSHGLVHRPHLFLIHAAPVHLESGQSARDLLQVFRG